jgi:hypothetical protein
MILNQSPVDFSILAFFEVKNRKSGTLIEILQKPADMEGRPVGGLKTGPILFREFPTVPRECAEPFP